MHTRRNAPVKRRYMPYPDITKTYLGIQHVNILQYLHELNGNVHYINISNVPTLNCAACSLQRSNRDERSAVREQRPQPIRYSRYVTAATLEPVRHSSYATAATPQPLHAIPHRHHRNMRARIRSSRTSQTFWTLCPRWRVLGGCVAVGHYWSHPLNFEGTNRDIRTVPAIMQQVSDVHLSFLV